jgi:hypothetical protein
MRKEHISRNLTCPLANATPSILLDTFAFLAKTVITHAASSLIVTRMPSLLLALYTNETLLRVPVVNSFTFQLRPGATRLLEHLREHQRAGRLDVALLTPDTDFFAARLLAPLTERYKTFGLVTSATGAAGGAALERHWRQRAMELDAKSSLRILVAGTRQALVGVWRAEETVVLSPYLALSKRDRAAQRAELKELGLKGRARNIHEEDLTLENLAHLVDDALEVPGTPIVDVLKTSPWATPFHYPLLGHAFALAAD